LIRCHSLFSMVGIFSVLPHLFDLTLPARPWLSKMLYDKNDIDNIVDISVEACTIHLVLPQNLFWDSSSDMGTHMEQVYELRYYL